MTSLTLWAWAWVSSRYWWWTGKLGVRQSIGSQRFSHFWAAELNWTTLVGQNKLYKQEHLLSVKPISTDVLQCQPATNLAVYSWALKLLLGPKDTGQLSCCLHSAMTHTTSLVRGPFHWSLPSTWATVSLCLKACAWAQVHIYLCIKGGKCIQYIHTYYPPQSLLPRPL